MIRGHYVCRQYVDKIIWIALPVIFTAFSKEKWRLTACSKITRLRRQHENTWADLHRRLMSMPFDYGRLFLENVFEFIEQTALSMSSCVGYLVPCLLSTTAFVMGLNSLISNESRCFPDVTYICHGHRPSDNWEVPSDEELCSRSCYNLRDNCDIGNFLIERCTSSGLVKTLAQWFSTFFAPGPTWSILIETATHLPRATHLSPPPHR